MSEGFAERKMLRKQRIVILSYYRFPCREVDFEYLFSEELGKQFDILFLFQGDRQSGNIVRWRNAGILLSKKIRADNFCARIINRILEWQKLLQLYELIRAGEAGIVFVRDLPLEALLLARLKKFFPFLLCFQYTAPMGDISLEAYRANKSLARAKYLVQGRLFNMLIGKALSVCDLVFPISEYHKETLCRFIPAEKMVAAGMGVPEDWADKKVAPVPFLRDLKEKNFLLTYFGNMGFAREPQFMLRVLAGVIKTIPNCKLILMGRVCDRWEEEELQAICRRLGITEHVIFTGQLDRNVLRDYLAYCDVSICAVPPKPCFQVMSPTKLYESLGCGIPVVASKGIPEMEKLVRDSGGGILADYVESAFVEGIVELLGNSDLRSAMASRGKAYVQEFCGYKPTARKIAARLSLHRL